MVYQLDLSYRSSCVHILHSLVLSNILIVIIINENNEVPYDRISTINYSIGYKMIRLARAPLEIW